MDRHERLNALLEMVGQRDRIDVDDTAAELDVSPATVRRDLHHLAERRLLTRTRGGAVASNVAYDLPLRHKAARHADQKQRIATAAANLVDRGMVVGLNGGTTITEVSRAIAIRQDLAERSDSPALTIVTNALNIANELAVRPSIKIVVTGGVARQQSFELTGPLATRILEEITLDLVLLGVDAIDPVRGAYAHHEGEASINRLMVSRARHVAVVGDSSKLGGYAFARICAIDEVHTLVTDSQAEQPMLAAFESEGLRIIAA
ncbi:DeoR/GlpR family DNA-binding transcription regulator [Actinoalloteichus hymeniacidonis]|uniref:Transcriptional regulator, DeoR family n=1 Tax=Actinoalloteichus hymeniacidonis TaxID=340345 RepID=A0AAC9MZJ5_9PSEU|nr:DeoR/GlpR family DNA-binding transcription regulator [Actinoalloteichus hymeniacidonis]AOS64142.1 transcriptional regulator, DeoR family [Actinoalloteichus hymeniacidonis]MBB5907792.1 DeoR family transcriptional regulator of aga operon [Actinoalloteichus hymeniacidonis]